MNGFIEYSQAVTTNNHNILINIAIVITHKMKSLTPLGKKSYMVNTSAIEVLSEFRYE
jgi:hypothetical protein